MTNLKYACFPVGIQNISCYTFTYKRVISFDTNVLAAMLSCTCTWIWNEQLLHITSVCLRWDAMNNFLSRKEKSYVSMFSYLDSTHIPLDICTCMKHHCLHRCADNHVHGNMDQNLKRNHTWSNISKNSEKSSEREDNKPDTKCKNQYSISQITFWDTNIIALSYVSRFSGLYLTHIPPDTCRHMMHHYFHKYDSNRVQGHMDQNLERNKFAWQNI